MGSRAELARKVAHLNSMAQIHKGMGPGVRDARIEAGMTQAELAAKVKVSAQHISNVESGRQQGTVALLIAIAKALTGWEDLET